MDYKDYFEYSTAQNTILKFFLSQHIFDRVLVTFLGTGSIWFTRNQRQLTKR